MSRPNVRALRATARHVRKNAEKFNLSVFVDRDRPVNHAGRPVCGTVACAAGWAAIKGIAGLSWRCHPGGGTIIHTDTGKLDWLAIEAAFRISASEILPCETADYLFTGEYFDDGWEASPETVAARIEAFCDNIDKGLSEDDAIEKAARQVP